MNNKNLLITINHNKTHKEKSRIENRLSLLNNINSEVQNSSNNLNAIENNISLKTLINNKLKLEMAEAKDDCNFNYEKKIRFSEFLKSLFVCNKKINDKIGLIHNFRIKILSEEHLYRNHINLYIIHKIFQIDEPYKFDIKELYNNL